MYDKYIYIYIYKVPGIYIHTYIHTFRAALIFLTIKLKWLRHRYIHAYTITCIHFILMCFQGRAYIYSVFAVIYVFILLYISLFCYILVYPVIHTFIPLCIRLFRYIFVYSVIYKFIPLCIRLFYQIVTVKVYIHRNIHA